MKQFEPFLRGMKTRRVMDDATQVGVKRIETSVGEAGTALKGAGTVLVALATSGPTSLQRLQEGTGLGFTEFADAVKALLDSGLVELEGPSGEEIARLSTTGSALTTDRS